MQMGKPADALLLHPFLVMQDWALVARVRRKLPGAVLVEMRGPGLEEGAGMMQADDHLVCACIGGLRAPAHKHTSLNCCQSLHYSALIVCQLYK
jgi:hypothetical protein